MGRAMRSRCVWLLCLASLFGTVRLAQAEVRYSLGASYVTQTYQFVEASSYPGPSLSADVWDPQRSIGFHASWSSGITKLRDDHNFPRRENLFHWVLQLHLLFGKRLGALSASAGVGFDFNQIQAYRVSDGGNTYSKSNLVLGAHGALAFDVVKARHGTYQVAGMIGLTSLPDLLGLCDGDFSCTPMTTTAALALSFRPN